MSKKKVLIVDDDSDIRLMLQRSLTMMGPDYEVAIAGDTVTAIEMVEKGDFALVLADYMMPVMTGVDLALAVQRISPETQVVLMTAYGTAGLRDATKFLGIKQVLDKPFNLDTIREIVKRAVNRTNQEEKLTQINARVQDKRVYDLLRNLQINAGVRCVLLITSGGAPVHVVGQVDKIEVKGVCALVAANFLAAAELADLLGNETIFKSSYYEGNNYNIYAYYVNEQLLLALVFEAKQKPGSVWFYTKQVATVLANFLGSASPPDASV
jgi:CheY-like chemotaxis protein/predicted regulator of Ras-like GTPase activity (Roadblock/LC7/MglB family)